MLTYHATKAIRTSTAFKEYVLTKHHNKYTNKQIASMATTDFGIPISYNYISQVLLRWGIRSPNGTTHNHIKNRSPYAFEKGELK